MRFPDPLKIIRASGADEYGNPGKGFVGATETDGVGFLVKEDLVLMPAETEISEGDRLRVRGVLYVAVDADEIRSPAKTVLWSVTVEEVPE